MPPIHPVREFYEDVCPIPDCTSGRLQSITRAGQHFATKRHRELSRKLKESDNKKYRDVFLSWARKMNYMSVISGIPSRAPLRSLAANSQEHPTLNINNRTLKKSSSVNLHRPNANATPQRAQRTKSTPTASARTVAGLHLSPSSNPITWLPPVVVNPTRPSRTSSSPHLAEPDQPRVVRWATSTPPPSNVFESSLPPSLESFYYYDFNKGPATIFCGVPYFWNDGVPKHIPPPALLPPSLIPPVSHSNEHVASGYIFAPNTPNCNPQLPQNLHSIPSTPTTPSRNRSVDGTIHHNSDDTVIDEEYLRDSAPSVGSNEEIDGNESKSVAQDLDSMGNMVTSPSTIPDEHHEDLLRSLIGDSSAVLSYQSSTASFTTVNTSPGFEEFLSLRSHRLQLPSPSELRNSAMPSPRTSYRSPMALFAHSNQSLPIEPIRMELIDSNKSLPVPLPIEALLEGGAHDIDSGGDYDSGDEGFDISY